MKNTQQNIKNMDKELSFKDDIKIFQSVPKNERPDYLTKILHTPQLDDKNYKPKKCDYPQMAKWKYGDHQLNYHFLNQTQKPKGIVFYFHGMNSHGGSSGYFASSLAKITQDINIFSLDFLNFGRSASPNPGYIESFESLIQQAEAFISFIIQRYQNKPKIFASGMSFGGSICYKIASKPNHLIDGCILLAPALRENYMSAPFMKKVGKMIGFLFPKLQTFQQTFNSATRHDLTQLVKSDPYNYTGKVIPGSVRVILNGMQEISKTFDQFKAPYILFQSGIDKMVDPFAALDLDMASKSEDKTTYFCKDMWHAVFAEPQIDEIIEVISKWIEKRK